MEQHGLCTGTRRMREKKRVVGRKRDEELAGFIGLGLINSYGEVNINLDSNSVTREQSRSSPIAATFFPIGSPTPSCAPLCVRKVSDPKGN